MQKETMAVFSPLAAPPFFIGLFRENTGIGIDDELEQAFKRREYEDSYNASQLIPEFPPGSEFAPALLVMDIRQFQDLVRIKSKEVEKEQVV